ncbi:MAG: hypothetical protein FWG66_02335 [Spirochaetes bacterium]|nr:hypothetical protein [Spirochaetota bacterium]
MHRFAWSGDGGILQYEVQIEIEVAGVFSPFLQEFTADTFFYVTLLPGSFRLRIVPHGFQGTVGEPTEWSYFSVLPPPEPEEPEETDEPDEPAVPQEAVAEATAEAVTVDVPAVPAIPTVPEAAPAPAAGFEPRDDGVFFAGLFFDSSRYGRYNAAAGGGFLLGRNFYSLGIGMGYGVSLLFAQDPEDFVFVEMLAFFRLRLPVFDIDPGLFLQAEAGIVTFTHAEIQTASRSAASFGLRAGWNFPFLDRWSLEPSIRFGFPYLFGFNLSVNFSF